jgi:hypothetical protein
MMEHICDRKGPSAKVIDDADGEEIMRIYRTCMVCGVPQVFERSGPTGGRSDPQDFVGV